MECKKLMHSAPMMFQIREEIQANISFTEPDATAIFTEVAKQWTFESEKSKDLWIGVATKRFRTMCYHTNLLLRQHGYELTRLDYDR